MNLLVFFTIGSRWLFAWAPFVKILVVIDGSVDLYWGPVPETPSPVLDDDTTYVDVDEKDEEVGKIVSD